MKRDTPERQVLRERANGNMQLDTLNTFLVETVKHTATDLHICVGSQPLMRVNSKLENIPGTSVLSAEDVSNIVGESLDPAKMETLQKK